MKSHYAAEGIAGACPPVARNGSLHQHRVQQELQEIKKVAQANEANCKNDHLMAGKKNGK